MTEQAVQPGGLGEVGRLVGVFWEPKPVFEDLAARPRWWAPLILLTVLSLVFVVTLSRVVGWDTAIRQQIESTPRVAQMPAEQRERAMQAMARFASVFGYAGAASGIAISTLVIAAVLLGVFNLVGGANLKYRQAFSLTCYAFLPKGLSTILALVVMLLKNPADFDLQNPLPLNLGAFFDPATTARWLQALAGSIDLFSFWVILLLALGFSIAARRMEFGKSLLLVLLPWSVVVILKCGWAAAFG